jgi:hypothetical protein
MPGKKLIFLIKKHLYLYVFIIFSSPLLLAQQTEDVPVFDEPAEAEAPVPEEDAVTEEPSSSPDETAEAAEETQEPATGEAAGAQSGDFDVFQPSEEISEDLAVPFPADI